ncbi:hypothetical protein [Nannocystis punicea]|uniref:Uncharacterized protein n=1 Tax=Nannocystis punicea TaxID=2995304 RepID=A0ABY7GV41_9BACT|nr:hypothetical protein [Nannocystis poenicansa]WAS90811.1 hypothetical protein O0S08_31875 [Nannocystis poenicansa]
MHVSMLSVPQGVCMVRLLLPGGPSSRSARGEMLLYINGSTLFGFGARWDHGRFCDDSFVLRGEQTATEPQAWASLGPSVPPKFPPPPRPAGQEKVTAVANITASSLLGNKSAQNARTPLKGSIVDYVAAVVGERRDVKIDEVACSGPSAPVGDCVAVVGDPCDHEPVVPECEAMLLTVVVDLARGRLDRAEVNGYPVETHDDVARWERIAP